MARIFHLISGPRNISTALMYSFAQRPDMKVIDEPLYGHYLSRVDVQHPGREDVLDSMEIDGEKTMKILIEMAHGPSHLFLKNMAHHYIRLPYEYLLQFTNIFLIRDPRDMLLSLIHQIPEPVMRDTGLQRQWELFNFLLESGLEPLVLEASSLLSAPKSVLNSLCRKLDVKFYNQMLSWPEGPKEFDGIWAKYWYQSVHKTTGFIRFEQRTGELPDRLLPLYQQCLVFYERLYHYAIQIEDAEKKETDSSGSQK